MKTTKKASWTQQADDFSARVSARIRELEPLAAELSELRVLAQRLGLDKPAAAMAGAGAKPSRKRAAAPRRSRPGGRRAQLLELVRATPGITVPQLGETLGVDSTGLYRVVRTLQAEGLIAKDGAHLRPTPHAVTTPDSEAAAA